MSLTDLPILGMLRNRMQWHQARQALLAENVANADMPRFRPRDLAEIGGASGPSGLTAPSAAIVGGDGLARTDSGHIGLASADGPNADAKRFKGFEVRPSGNGVNLEEEMMKAGENQSDYQMVASLYQKSLDALKIAVGKR
ncbi:flagellar basal body rod protein FlgB [Methylobacterium brachythecii]|uniref:Flagellar basal body rod protein FlgB n=1 Tax=Methylobacterium brachythecii TaxID=1176177 RepID=A0A7W6ALD1_9HYPH|nr:flagellar basal body rod protein FlgB [Methylobacterium brachythecii]MBB3901877.1 flagellar basal-body rod protein FlgB [Methylobacterium brachythecii]GLS43257.1 flagellar basal body rod protein FlgB [Methylobacterium brachythecii]